MKDEDRKYTTKVTIEVEWSHYDTTDPQCVIGNVIDKVRCPAATKVNFVSALTNYNLRGEPLKHFVSVDEAKEDK